MNHIDIIGRLVADPETRTVSDAAMCKFTVAVQRDYTPKGEEKQADFIDCVAWRRNAEFIAKYFTKGRMIAVAGSLQIRQYTDREGNKRKVAEVVVDHAYFCGDKPRDNYAIVDDDEQLPF